MKHLLAPPPQDTRTSAALLCIRVVSGLAMMFHGWPKIQNPFAWMGADSTMPGFLQALAALSEFGGGFAWMLGLLTPVASFGMACTMFVAVTRHMGRGDPFVGKGGSYELASVYLVIAILMLLAGPGRFSVDSRLFKRRHPGR